MQHRNMVSPRTFFTEEGFPLLLKCNTATWYHPLHSLQKRVFLFCSNATPQHGITPYILYRRGFSSSAQMQHRNMVSPRTFFAEEGFPLLLKCNTATWYHPLHSLQKRVFLFCSNATPQHATPQHGITPYILYRRGFSSSAQMQHGIRNMVSPQHGITPYILYRNATPQHGITPYILYRRGFSSSAQMQHRNMVSPRTFFTEEGFPLLLKCNTATWYHPVHSLQKRVFLFCSNATPQHGITPYILCTTPYILYRRGFSSSAQMQHRNMVSPLTFFTEEGFPLLLKCNTATWYHPVHSLHSSANATWYHPVHSLQKRVFLFCSNEHRNMVSPLTFFTEEGFQSNISPPTSPVIQRQPSNPSQINGANNEENDGGWYRNTTKQ